MPKGEAALCGFSVSRTNVERSTKANAEQAGRAGRVILEVSDIKAGVQRRQAAKYQGAYASCTDCSKGWSFAMFDPDGTMVSFVQPSAGTQ